MTRSETASAYFSKGYGCAQSVLCAFRESFNLDEETALRIATGFGSGMGRLCEVCGSLTGGFMVIGLKWGKVITDGSKYGTDTETTYRLVAELASRFKERHGTILCRELLECDLSNPDERARAAREGLFQTRCPRYVLDSVEILETLIDEPGG